MLFVDYNSSIRDIFKQVDGISQHGLEELFNEDVIAGRHSYSDAIIDAGLASKEDVLSLVAEFLGYELQVGEVTEIETEAISTIDSMGLYPFIFRKEAFTFLPQIRLIQQ